MIRAIRARVASDEYIFFILYHVNTIILVLRD